MKRDIKKVLTEAFFLENEKEINKIVFKIIVATNAVPFLLFIFSKIGVFQVSLVNCLIILGVTAVSTIIDYFLINKSTKRRKISNYFGLAALMVFITLCGSNKYIGIYITFGIIPVIASLYYDKSLTRRVSIFSYFLMLAALFLKWKSHATIFTNDTNDFSFMASYFPMIMGFTIEYIFVFLISELLTKRNFFLLHRMSNNLKERTVFLEKLTKSKAEIEHKNHVLEDTQFRIIEFVAQCLGSHDLFTGRHVIHTTEYVGIIARRLRDMGYYTDELTDENINLYSSAAFLHDIGKIHIPEGILNKVGKFTDEEFERMKSHPDEGRKLLEFLPTIGDGRFNEIAIQMAFCHHEKWNGMGYPRKISGKEIPLCARIMAGADVLDALISQRLYKEPMSMDQAMKVFEESSGSHFEPCVAEAVIACRNEIEVIDKEFKEQESASNNQELQWWYSYHKNKK